MERFCKDCIKRIEKFCVYLEKYVPKKFDGKENPATDCKKYVKKNK